MPVYVRKNLLSITPDSLGNRSSDEDDYVTDPDQMIDNLPQPFRLVNKIITSVLDKAWDRIGHRERTIEEERKKIPIPEYDNAEIIDQYKDSPGVTESPDGTAVFLGLPDDLIVLDPITRQPIATWTSEEAGNKHETSEISNITTVQIGVQACLIISIYKSGQGRLHIYSNPLLLFVKDLDTEISPGSKILEGVVCDDGEYLGLTSEGKEGEVWLDIFKIPRDNWLKEVENIQNLVSKQQVTSQNAEENKGDSKPSSQGGSPVPGGTTTWNPSNLAKPTQVVRVTAPSTGVTGASSITLPGTSSPAMDEWISTIGVGKKHQLTEQHLQMRRTVAERELATFLGHQPKEITYHNERSKSCRWLILNKTGRQPSSVMVSDGQYLVCAWDKTSFLSMYDLQKTAKDMERNPDRVIPFGADITALSLSPCGFLIAVGLRDSSVILFDEFVGLPLFVERVSRSEVEFLTFPVSSSVQPADDAMAELSDLSAGGVITIAGTRDGALISFSFDYSSRLVTKIVIRDGSKLEDTHLKTILPVRSLHNVLLIMTQGGELSMLDFLTGEVLCKVKVPPPYSINNLGNILSLAASGQQMLLKATSVSGGDDDASVSNAMKETALLAYQLQSFSCLDTRWKTLAEQEAKPPTLLHTTTLNKRVDWLLSKHLKDSHERQIRIQQRWESLREFTQQR
ncbi:WD repeat-containing protein 93-like isoform X2 [Apostichopus japonicus]|uniref:WD repeat-containing protein 93-like isoform X1 n=1 Tax=Stichopus japonicus TaxID=307972 RepID=UPI003AB4E1AC